MCFNTKLVWYPVHEWRQYLQRERNKTDRSGQHRSAPPALLYMISGLCSGALYYRDISSYNGPITALNTIRPAIDRKYIKRKYHLPRKSHKQQTETIRAWSERNISSIYISFYFAIFLEDTWGISLPIVHLFLKVFKSLGNFPEQRSWRTIYFVSYWGRQLLVIKMRTVWRGWGSSNTGESTVTESWRRGGLFIQYKLPRLLRAPPPTHHSYHKQDVVQQDLGKSNIY